MQVSVENTGGLERRLTVQVPGEEIQEKVNTKLRELSKQVRIKGFRPGRVPLSVVKQRYGKQVRLDIVNETVQQSLQQAIMDEQLRPASPPRLDSELAGMDGGDLEFQAVIEVYPEIQTIDVSDLAIERPEAEVTDDDVETMLNTLREQRRSWNAVERKPQEGDHAALEYSAETKQGRVPGEGELRLAIVIGQSGFDELEKAVCSLEPGGSKSVKLKFPENFREQELADQKAKVELKLVSVSESELPEVDEEFIQSFGVEDGSVDSLKTEIRGNLERELRQAETSFLKTQLLDELVRSVPDLEVPAAIVREEAVSMAARVASQQGQQEPDPSLVEAFMEQAERRVRAGLLLGELANQNDIQIDRTKVRDAIETVASTYEQPAEVMQLYYGNPQMLQQVESSVLEEQVVDWVLENAKVTTKAMSMQDVISGASVASSSV